MKRIITVAFLLIASSALWGQTNNKAIYLIDGKRIENFDGSQLVNHRITGYTIDAKTNTHVITTHLENAYIQSMPPEFIGGQNASYIDRKGRVYVLEGNFVDTNFIKSLNKGNYIKIREITDRNDKAFELYSNMLKKYSNKEPKTIMLYTRPMLDKNIVYVVDNRVVDEKEFMSLGMTKIESIKVIKDPENELFKRFAKDDTYQVLYVTLKDLNSATL